MGTDCKSVGSYLRWFKSSSAQKIVYDYLFFPFFTNDVIISIFWKILKIIYDVFFVKKVTYLIQILKKPLSSSPRRNKKFTKTKIFPHARAKPLILCEAQACMLLNSLILTVKRLIVFLWKTMRFTHYCHPKGDHGNPKSYNLVRSTTMHAYP